MNIMELYFFNEILDLEKKKADISLQRGYLKINKCHTTNTVFNKKNLNETPFLYEEHREENKSMGCCLHIGILKIYIVTIKWLDWGSSLKLLLVLLLQNLSNVVKREQPTKGIG